MSAGTLISLEEYLRTSYSPDMEYRDGVLVERNVGDERHSFLQAMLALYVGNRRKRWGIRIYTELRTKVQERWYPIPDFCIYPAAGFDGQIPTVPPLLWVEILSPQDRIATVRRKAQDLVAQGVPRVWIVDPKSLESEVWTAAGMEPVNDRTLRIPDSPIVIPLDEVVED
jgi:Uma2 family endonuclease